jgi:hypothetical protein
MGMTPSPPAIAGPLRRWANGCIAIFIAVQVGLVLRATLPLPGKLHGPWPWRMFERRSPWERTLVATGIDASGRRHELPLHDIFRYARGTTRLYAYHQLESLGDTAGVPAQAAFAAYIARRSAEHGLQVRAVDLRWITTNLDTGLSEERPIGVFSVGANGR